MLAKDDAILYMHMRNIKILFLFEVWNFWVGRAHETTIQVEVALPAKIFNVLANFCRLINWYVTDLTKCSYKSQVLDTTNSTPC